MSAAILAAIAGVLGVTLGRVWDGRSEASRWRRDQKTASYQRLAEAFIFLYEDIRAIALAEPNTTRSLDAIEHTRRDKTWDNALAAVWLHGSTPVVTAASSMDHVVTQLFYDAQERPFQIKEWNQARMPSADAFEGFIAAARKELSLSTVEIQLFPYTPN